MLIVLRKQSKTLQFPCIRQTEDLGDLRYWNFQKQPCSRYVFLPLTENPPVTLFSSSLARPVTLLPFPHPLGPLYRPRAIAVRYVVQRSSQRFSLY